MSARASGNLCIAVRRRPGWWTPATVIATFAATLAAFRESRRDRPRLRTSARALVLLAARRRDDDWQAGGACQSRSAAAARAHRQRQHVRGPGILPQNALAAHS